MKKLHLFLSALMVLATTLMVDAQVRNSSGVRSSNDNSNRNSAAVQNNSVRSSSQNLPKEKTQISQSEKVNKNQTRGITNQGNVRNSANNSASVRNESNTVRNNSGQTVRNSSIDARSSANPRANQGVRSTNVEKIPEVQNFNKSNVRYANSNPNRNQYHANNNAKFRQIRYNNYNYYMDDGYYYQYYDNRYKRVAAPFGMMVPTLPYGYSNIYISGNQYYYANGTYYSWDRANYYVIQPPVGAIVFALPPYSEKVYINGRKYYEYDGAIYARVNFQGQRAYQVIGYIY